MSLFKHPTAIVESQHIGEDTKVWHFAHIREGARVGKGCVIGKSAYIDTDVEIGDRVKIENFVSVYRGVRIGDEVFVGPSATFTNDLYPRAFIWNEDRLVPTSVGRGASIGANATVVCGVSIGEYAMVGAGSVVVKDIPPFGLAYGNPARLKGFVCYCGKRLTDEVGRDEVHITYQCSCGRRVDIKREWIE